MLPETVYRLAQIDNIVGIKEATGNLERARELIDNVPTDFAIYSGDDATAIELILMGGQGNISVTANVAPAEMAELCRLGLAGEVEAARALQQKLMPLHTNLFVEANPIPVKWAMAEMKLIDSGIRLPLTVLSEQYQDLVRNSLREAGII
jgi:4-hydroxy-tetrahydrodipicolinate synthase